MSGPSLDADWWSDRRAISLIAEAHLVGRTGARTSGSSIIFATARREPPLDPLATNRARSVGSIRSKPASDPRLSESGFGEVGHCPVGADPHQAIPWRPTCGHARDARRAAHCPRCPSRHSREHENVTVRGNHPHAAHLHQSWIGETTSMICGSVRKKRR